MSRQKQSPAMSQPQIEWVEIVEPNSKEHMYANLITGECCWDPPAGSRIKRTHENQWWELYDQNTGRFYYCNAFSQKTIWQRPHNSDIIPLAKLQTLKQNTESRRGLAARQEACATPVQIDVPSQSANYDHDPTLSFPPEPVNSPSTTATTASSGHSPSSSQSSLQSRQRSVQSRSVGCQTQCSPTVLSKPRRQTNKNKVCTSVSCQTALSSSHLLKRQCQPQQPQVRKRSTSRSRKADVPLGPVVPDCGAVQQALIKSLNPDASRRRPCRNDAKGAPERRISCSGAACLPSDGVVASASSYSLEQCPGSMVDADKLNTEVNRFLKHAGEADLKNLAAGCCATPPRRCAFEKSSKEMCSVSIDSSDPFMRSCLGQQQQQQHQATRRTSHSPLAGHSLTWGKVNGQRSVDTVAGGGQFPVTNSRMRMPSTKSFRHAFGDRGAESQKVGILRACEQSGRNRGGGPLISVAGSPQLWQAVDSPGSAPVHDASDVTIWKSHDSGIRSSDSYPRGDGDSSSQASAESPRLCDSGQSHPSTNGSVTKSPNLPIKLSLLEKSAAAPCLYERTPSSVNNPMYEHVTQHLTYSQLHQQFIVGNSIDPFSEQEIESSSSSEESVHDDDEELFADDEEGGPQSPTSLTSSQEEDDDDDEEEGEVDLRGAAYGRFVPTAKISPVASSTLPTSGRLASEGQESRSPIYDVPETPTQDSEEPCLCYSSGSVEPGVLFRGRTSDSSSTPVARLSNCTSGSDMALGRGKVSPVTEKMKSSVAVVTVGKNLLAEFAAQGRPQSVMVSQQQQQQQKHQPVAASPTTGGSSTLNRLAKGGGKSSLRANGLQPLLRDIDMEFYAHEYLNKHTKGLFRKRQSVQSVLSWTRDELKKSLIMTMDKSVKKEACEIFKRIQAYMGDRKVKSGVTMDMLALDVCVRGWAKPVLRDEIFLQICKQTTENPHPESTRRGWELLCMCLRFFPPTAMFTSYLDSYVSRYADPVLDAPEVAISQYAQHCCKRLERIVRCGARKGLRKPTVEEIEQARVHIFHPSMFGNTLEDVMTIQRERYPQRKLPWIQTTLSELVLQLNGAKTEGIFRVPGDIDEVNALKMRVDRWLVPPVSDPHVPASLLKLWYRELADPLVPDSLYDDCIQSASDPEKCCRLVDRLPHINRLVLIYLIRFLQIFSRPDIVALTKMDSNNLAMVMAPNCLRCQSEDPNVIFDNTRKEMQFLRNLMEHLDTSFVDAIV